MERYLDQDWHDGARQIIAATTRYEVYERDELLESLVDTLELGYLYPAQCDELLAACGLAVVGAFGDCDRRPLRAEGRREQIYVLRRARDENG